MGERYAQKLAYYYDFKSEEMKPLVETRLLMQDDILAFFKEKEISEPVQKTAKDEGISITEVQDDVADASSTSASYSQSPTETEQSEDKRYALTYYNPETGKAEVLTVTSTIKIKDYTKKVVEESVGMRSTYPLYSFIVTPLFKKEIDPLILQEIKDNAEYSTPPRFGGAAMVKIPKPQAAKTSKIVAVDLKGASRDALASAVKRKELAEKRIDEEIVVLEKAVDDLKSHHGAERVIERLPALSRVRFLTALRKKRLSTAVVLSLLEKDVSFLKNIKKKLSSLSLQELVDIARSIRKLKEK